MEFPKFNDLQEANIWATQKGEEISSKLGKKIHPIVLPYKENPFDVAVGFFKVPPRNIKLQAISTVLEKGKVEAGKILINYCLVKEESDLRILSEDPEYDDIYIGAILASNQVLSLSVDAYEELKKN